MQNSPTVAIYEVLKNIVSSSIFGVNVSLPGEIASFDKDKCTAVVKPLIKQRFHDGEVLSMPLIYNVPVHFPRSSSGGVFFPIEPGDGVLLIFCQRSLDEWLANGGEVDPRDNRMHDITDAFAIPGIFNPGAGQLPENNNTAMLIHNGQSITIKQDGSIEIGGTSLQKLLTETFKTLIYESHTHSVVIGSPGSTVTSSTPVSSPDPTGMSITKKVSAQ